MIDPFSYDGPIARADGQRPFNGYLWPMHEDWYCANKLLDNRINSRFEFSVVALADGRWSTSGFVWEIEDGRCVFATREAALRSSAAKFIRLVRNARRWTSCNDHLTENKAQALAAWALAIVGEPAPKLRPLAPPPPRPTGLPLLDLMACQ